MLVNIRLYALLRLRYPDYDCQQGINIELKEPATIEDALAEINLSSGEISIMLVNGRIENRTDFILAHKDVLEIFSHFPYGG